jgi:hypothetical protein
MSYYIYTEYGRGVHQIFVCPFVSSSSARGRAVWLAHEAHNLGVTGSNPVPATSLFSVKNPLFRRESVT